MTQLEILKLALIGAKEKLKDASRNCCTVFSSASVEDIRSALFAYDDIKELIEKCEKESSGCSQQPRQKINETVETVITSDSWNGSPTSKAGIILRIAALGLSVAAIIISLLKG